jgi:hypothetical protein
MATYLEQLAKQARPTSLEDWGSNRQATAQNDFLDELDLAVTGRLTKEETEAFDACCHKATVDEMVDEGLRLARLAASR